MIEFLQLPEDRRRLFIEQVSAETGMSVKAVEKDWWVTLGLKAVFSLPMAEYFIFKGGTSLSKGWGLIERLSEDIDIALSPEAFGRAYQPAPTHSYVKRLKKEGTAHTSQLIADALYTRLVESGVPADLFSVSVALVKPELPDKDPQTIYIHYHSLYEQSGYIADDVKVEFGVRSLLEPYQDVSIRSVIGATLQVTSYTEQSFAVRAVVPEKTLIEKLLLLHEKFSRQGMEEMAIGERQSRHLADIVRLKQKGIHEKVLANPALFDTLVAHRRHYVRLKGVDYDGMTRQTLQVVPPQGVIDQYREDYAVMQAEMMYGEAPDFEVLIDEVKQLLELMALGG